MNVVPMIALPMKAGLTAVPTPMRRRGVLIGIAAVLAIAGCSGSDSAPPASTGLTTAPATTAPVDGPATSPAAVVTEPGPSATGATGEPSVAISKAAPVPIGKAARISPKVLVVVGKVHQLKVKAEHPGEMAGPAISVAVKVRNNSTKPFSLSGMVVTASYGDGVPGDQTTSGPSKPMTGKLAVGKSALGTYVFMVPTKDADSLHIEVSSDQSPTIVQFAR